METSAQTITRPSFAAVNAPQNALASPSIPAAANLVTKVSTEECAGTSPRPSPDADSDVLEDIPPKPPTQDDMAVDLSDTEDLITVYTANTGVNAADAPTNIYAPASASTRPDYSSTTGESQGELSFTDTEFFLESDIPFGGPSGRATHSSSGEPSAGPSSMDPRVPFCKNCKSTSDCVYWKKGTFSTQKGALRAYRASLLPATKEGPTTASSLKPPGTANKLEVSRPQPNTMIKDIEFLDGDISHSQKRCPSSIIKLIGRNLVEFDKRIASGLWSANRTCYVDRERESLYVNPKTDREVLVARYRYGGSHQFFVVWLPGRDPSDVLEPAVCKFRVYNNDGHVIRNGKSWLPLVWKTWVPQKATHKAARDIIRYIRDTAPNPKWTSQHSTNQTSLDVVDLDLDESKDKRQASAKRKLSAGQHTDLKRVREDSTVSNSYARNGVSTTKRHKKHNAGQSWKENPNTIADSGPGGLFPSGPFSSASIDEPTHSHATRSSTKDALFKHIARPPSANFVVREPRKKGPNLSVSFQDSSGEVRGTFTYEECDTAQKLFDVACVAQIAQIEPPATRLLKIKFSGGGEGRLRPDNEQDFQIVFEAELKKLVTGALGGSEFHVTISPYL